MVSGIPPLSILSFDYGERLQAIHSLFTQEILKKGFLTSKAFYATYTHKDNHMEKYFFAINEIFDFIESAIKKMKLKNF